MKNKKIMIVDDNVEFLEELEETLALSGYELVAVRDSLEALSAAKKANPAMVLLDLKMPGKDGFQVADELRHVEEFAHIPIVAVTGYFKDEFVPLMEMCGIKKYLKKPFQPLDVITCIEEHLAEN